MRQFFLSFLLFFLFFGCSQKKYFKPKQVSWSNLEVKKYYIDSYIDEINSVGATTESLLFIDKNGVSKQKLPKNFIFLNSSDSSIIASNELDSIYINNIGIIKLNQSVIAASKKNNLLALIFSNNSIAIYDLNKKEFKFKKYFKSSVLNDTRIANPLFLDSVVLFPTLNGEVVVVDEEDFSINKIPIDLEHDIKNIILLKNFEDTLVVATPNKMFSLKDGKITTKEFFIQSYNFDKNYIYIATLDGKVLKLSPTLEILKEKKYKFAKIGAIAVTKNNIYLAEWQGYIIKLDKDFKKDTIYLDVIENDEKIIGLGNKIYNGNRVLIFK